MIISRTPFRISLLGGGSDIREFYKRDYGAVVSAAIDKYMYIVLHPYFHDKIRIKYSKVEDVDHIEDIHHPIVRECLRKMKVSSGLEIASIADIPARTGLGSSSAFTVGLLHLLYSYKRKTVSKEKLAQDACSIEIDILKEPIGKQDQYASSFGGINYIRFNKDNSVKVEPLLTSHKERARLLENLMLFYVGGERNAREILNRQKKNLANGRKLRSMKRMLYLCEELRAVLCSSKIEPVGRLLHEGWLLKKDMADGISNGNIDRYYAEALNAGAHGGKLLGAGGAGFLLLFCEKRFQESVRKRLNLKELAFNFDCAGSKIIYREDY